MEEAVLINGKNSPIRISGNSTSINGGSYSITPTTYGLTGKLSEFNFNNSHYMYVSEINFYQGHASESRSGYVKETAYEEYRNTNNLSKLKKTENWFDEFETAKEGDLFKIDKVEFNDYETAGSTKYYILKKAEFKITNLQIDFSNFGNFPTENQNLGDPDYCKITEIDFDDSPYFFSSKDEGHFFTKNFKNKINTVTISAEAKEIIYEGIIKICFRIHYIVKDVLELLAIADLSEIKTFLGGISSGSNARAEINSASTLSSGLKFTRTDKSIAHLLLDWGYKDLASTKELPLEVGSEQFYGGFYTPYENYYNAIVNFYYNLIGKDENLIFDPPLYPPSTWSDTQLIEQDTKRLQYISTILPPSAITLLSIDERIRILQDFATGNITGNKEDVVLKIFQSIPMNHQDATYFLNKLQTTMILDGSKQYTLFEKLYKKINDSILFFGKDNRQTLMLTTFSLWFISAFNPAINTNDFEDVTTQDLDNIDSALQGYENDPVIIPYSSEKSFGFYMDNMQFEFTSGKISVNQEKIKVVQTTNINQNPVQKYFETIGSYKYFQAVSLSQYKEDDVAIKIPFVDINQPGQEKTAILPLFYLKYMDDYGDSQDLWNGIGLALDVGLTFTGVGNITKLRHLRHLGKFGRAYRAYKRGSQTAEVLFTIKGVWTGVQGVAAAIEVSSSLLSAYLSYSTGNCTDYKDDVETNISDATPEGQVPDDSQQNDEYKRCKKLDEILFWIQIGSFGLDVLASKMIRKKAKELKSLGYPPEFNTNYTQLRDWFDDLNDAEIDNYANFLQQIPPASRQVIESKLLADSVLQQKFLDDFGALGNDELLAMMELMAKNNGAAVDNWINLRTLSIHPEYKNAEVLTDNILSNRYINYYSISNLKTELQKFDDISRLEFMKSSVSQVTPLPTKGYLSMWMKLKNQGNLANYQTEVILRKFENFDDELLDKAVYELSHTGQRGKDVRKLINQNADDIVTQFKPILEDPHKVWSSKELFSPAWERWRKSYFYKFITYTGRKFEGFVNDRFAIRNSNEYNALQNWMSTNGIAKNLDDYDLFTSVQLKYNSTGNFFVADQVFVKYTVNQVGKKKIDDIIIIEAKLKQTTATSVNQKGAINAAYDNNFNGFEMRNNKRKSKYNRKNQVDDSYGYFKFNGQPTIIKAYDLDNGEEISGFKRLTNTDNN